MNSLDIIVDINYHGRCMADHSNRITVEDFMNYFERRLGEFREDMTRQVRRLATLPERKCTKCCKLFLPARAEQETCSSECDGIPF